MEPDVFVPANTCVASEQVLKEGNKFTAILGQQKKGLPLQLQQSSNIIHSIKKHREPDNDLLLSLQKVRELNLARFQEALLTSAK